MSLISHYLHSNLNIKNDYEEAKFKLELKSTNKVCPPSQFLEIFKGAKTLCRDLSQDS